MSTAILRISEESHRILQMLSQSTKRSMQDLAAEAIEEYRRKMLFEAADEAYEALVNDQEYQSELELWGAANLDGLPDEHWTSGGDARSARSE